jgi:hypothetical protein
VFTVFAFVVLLGTVFLWRLALHAPHPRVSSPNTSPCRTPVMHGAK